MITQMSLDCVPTELKAAIAIRSDQMCKSFEEWRRDRWEAERNKQYERADRLDEELVPYLSLPADPAVTIIGGLGGYVRVNDNLFP